MAIEKIINIKVNDGELQDLDNDLKSVASGFDKVDNSAQKTSKSIDDVTKNGGAIAVLDRLTGGLATQFKDAYEASKLFSFSLKGLKTAFIATGIGAFVVALGLVVNYWEDIQDYVTGTNRELENQIDILSKRGDLEERDLDLLNKKDNILKLQGKTQKEINDLKKKELEDIINIRQQELELAKERLKSLLDLQTAGGSTLEGFFRITQTIIVGIGQQIDDLFSKFGFDTNFGKSGFNATNSIIEGIFGTQENIDAQKLRIKELEDTLITAQNNLAGIILSEQDGTKRGKVTGSGGLNSIQEQELKTLSEFENAKNDVRINAIQEELRLQSLAADERIALEQSVANAKVGIAQNTLALIGSIVEQDSALGKGVAVAQATISGIEGVQNAYTSAQKSPITTLFPAYPIVQAGLAGAFSALQIQKILSVDPTGRSTPNLGGSNVGGQSAPSFNVVGTSGVNQLAQTLNQEQQPIEAFVVASNVSGAQELNRNIVETATIG